MKAASFEYVRPSNVAGALAALSRGGKLIAGGQSLGPMLNLRLARPSLLVDVSRLIALQRLEDTGSGWRIGAGVTHARLEDARGTLPGGEMLCAVASGIAYRSVRNRGTIGGSLAHADPAADWPVALSALAATVNLRSAHGTRSIAVDRFVEGAFATALKDEEMIESIDVPKLSAAGRYGYYKYCRKTGEFAEASAAAVFDSTRSVARIFVGAPCARPRPLAALAERIAREGHTAATGDAVAQAVADNAPELDPIDRRMTAAAVMRALQQVFKP
ncbi:MAG TPA: FAD binding domain-containing protein [Xanthobacteraceae bacterium]|nr:FAD binding domain-containing protein [Xanthobacteraceae bacterium]